MNLNECLLDSPVTLETDLSAQKFRQMKVVTFIDLFAGMGGTRVGFESACLNVGVKSECVFTSEIKEHAVDVYQKNFIGSDIHGDITKIKLNDIPKFDYLLAGFPCQPFSVAGKRQGLLDDRGTLFFTILEIIKDKKPQGFLLENVEGLVKDNDGKTLALIESSLMDLGYQVSWRVLNSADFGVPQQRKRLYIVGHKTKKINLSFDCQDAKTVRDVVEHEFEFNETDFAKKLTKRFTPEQLHGKSIKDKRGGDNNIHSWDIDFRGVTTSEQKVLLGLLLKQRRQKSWAISKGIDWMDGMPLTTKEIRSFHDVPNLEKMLDDLVVKGYLRFEHPKKLVDKEGLRVRVPALEVEKGYNIVTGKLSFPITKILDPDGVAQTLVATEAGKTAVMTQKGLRKITVREGLRLSGFPETYAMDGVVYEKAFDLIGNTVMPPVIASIVERLLVL